jgi:hypothetical protein
MQLMCVHSAESYQVPAESAGCLRKNKAAKFTDLSAARQRTFLFSNDSTGRRLDTRNTIDRACRPANNQFPEDEE